MVTLLCISNPQQACTEKVTVSVYMCVFALICHHTHWIHKSKVPTD